MNHHCVEIEKMNRQRARERRRSDKQMDSLSTLTSFERTLCIDLEMKRHLSHTKQIVDESFFTKWNKYIIYSLSLE